jgi:hypothetical protein
MRVTQTVSFLLAVLLAAHPASAEEEDPTKRIEALEKRVQELEEQQEQGPGGFPEWIQRFHLAGNADFSYLYGEDNSIADEGRFAVDNFRLFLDVDLGEEVNLGKHSLVDSTSFYFEWDMVREAEQKNKAGAMYVRLDGLFGIQPLNIKFGRFPIPFGEEYLRFSEQRSDNPLISFSAAAPYNWDEGVLFFGSLPGQKLEYIFALMDGDDAFSVNTDSEPAFSGKLSYRPAPWAQLSMSGLHTGALGSAEVPAKSAMEFGFTHAEPFGSGTDVPNFQNGVEVPDDPENRIDTLDAWEVDLILTSEDWGRFWLAYGQARIRSEGASSFDRDLLYGIAEGILELRSVSESFSKIYLAARYSAIGTFDSNEGYSLEVLNDGSDLGFNTKSVKIVSLGLGLRLTPHVTFKVEYSFFDFEVVRGATAAIRRDAEGRNYFGVGLSARF